ncbi:MAG: PilZ domain-containing protein [Sphingomonas fennica]
MGLENRRAPRVAVNLTATMMAGFETDIPVVIIDISLTGAKIKADEVAVGTRVSIEHRGSWVQGRVMWSEIDRFGIRFDTPLRIGLLYDHAIRSAAAARAAPPPPPVVAEAPRLARTGFGRRAA